MFFLAPLFPPIIIINLLFSLSLQTVRTKEFKAKFLQHLEALMHMQEEVSLFFSY